MLSILSLNVHGHLNSGNRNRDGKVQALARETLSSSIANDALYALSTLSESRTVNEKAGNFHSLEAYGLCCTFANKLMHARKPDLGACQHGQSLFSASKLTIQVNAHMTELRIA